MKIFERTMNWSSSSAIEKPVLETPTISIDSKACEMNDETSEDLAASGDSKSNRNGTVTLDVTKALLLLGFTSWSAVEEGIDSFLTKYINYCCFQSKSPHLVIS